VSDLSPLDGMPLAQVDFPATPVTDLTPLKNLPLHSIYCQLSRVADLTPLSGMRLSKLHLAGTQVSDLEALRGMPLKYLYFDYTAVSDVSPLAGMDLQHLSFSGTQVSSLAMFKDLKLQSLGCTSAPVDDFSPLRDMPLTSLVCDFNIYRDTEVLRAIPSLGTINYQPAAEFWKDVEARDAAMREWVKRVASMPAEAQVQAVIDRLQELNPGFDRQTTHKVEDDVVTGLEFAADQVSDISPVRALTQLREFTCAGSAPGKGMLKDLWPLAGTSIVHLNVADTAVADLSALKTMKVVGLNINGTRVTDLSPLAGTAIHALFCRGTHIADLTPLGGSRLNFLDYFQTHVADITPLRDVPLQNVLCGFRLERDAEVLGSIGTLENINGKPVTAFLEDARKQRAAFESWIEGVAGLPAEQQVEAVAKKLQELNPGFDEKVTSEIRDGVVVKVSVNCDNVDDISAVRGLPGLAILVCYGTAQDRGKLTDLWPLVGMQKLAHLWCIGTQLTDLSPVRHMKLTHLWCDSTPVDDLSPLVGSSLISLSCAVTRVHDLSPLAKTRLTSLTCFNNRLTSLAPLKALPLTHLTCHNNNISDLSPLRGMPLEVLVCDFSPLRDAEILRKIKTLKTINGKPAAEFWKEVGGGQK
jgi:Leucine-rich repeat (LRR) protein